MLVLGPYLPIVGPGQEEKKDIPPFRRVVAMAKTGRMALAMKKTGSPELWPDSEPGGSPCASYTGSIKGRKQKLVNHSCKFAETRQDTAGSGGEVEEARHYAH
jgi:hypothetical protein